MHHQRALAKVLERLGPGGRAATLTLAELVDEYLEVYQAEPVTIAKLRWLLGKATAVLNPNRPKNANAHPRETLKRCPAGQGNYIAL